MEVRYLTTFLAVAEELHFGRAAQQLGLTQPALSQQIRRLEDDFGEQLFERSTRSVQLTEAGRALLAPARKAVHHVDDAREAVRAAGAGRVGRVSVSFVAGSSHLFVPALVRAVQETNRGVTMKLVTGLYRPQAIERLADGRLDLACTCAVTHEVGSPLGLPGIDTLSLGPEPLALVMPSTHPLADVPDATLADFAREPFVAIAPTAGSPWHEMSLVLCQSAGFAPDVLQEAQDELTALTLVAAGVGVAIAPYASRAVMHNPNLTWLELEQPSAVLESVLAWSPDHASPLTEAVVDIARKLHETGAAPGL